MVRIPSAVLVCLVLLVPRVQADEKKHHVDETKIDALMKKALEDFDAPGLACVVVKDDKVVYLKGRGVRDVKDGKPVTADTLFAIASCSKAFTATAVGFLTAEGKMSWDDPVRKHLPAYRMSDALAERDVTIRDLLSHRTGVIRHDILWIANDWSRDEMIRRSGFLRPDKSFRSVYGYNNLQYLAAGEASARAAETTWEKLVKSRIFDPLGMKTACFSTRDLEKSSDWARPHKKEDGGKPERIEPRNIDNMAPAGAINASVRDLGAWMRFQLGEGVFDGNRLLPADVLRETHKPVAVVPDTPESRRAFGDVTTQATYGMGWRIYDYRGRRVVEHGGSIFGYRSQVTLLPDQKLGIAIVTNLARTALPVATTYNLIDQLVDAPARNWNKVLIDMDDRIETKRKKDEADRVAKRKPNTKPSLPLAGYVGTYDEPAHGTVKLVLHDDQLSFQWGTYRLSVDHFHLDTFRIAEPPDLSRDSWGDRMVVFRFNSAGEVEGFGYLGHEFRKSRSSKK